MAASDEGDPVGPEAAMGWPGGSGPGGPESHATAAGEVLAANRAYYDAFEAADIDAMSALWEHGERVQCTHPGWASLRGWGAIAGSYFALFGNGRSLQFILTDEHVEVVGDTAWVSVDENILGTEIGATANALNVFVRGPHGWRMVVHHASQVVDTEEP
ncbi:MAG TPA: nuclear transport factor 2 family protein [Acidimicrobiales bacterium]